MKNLLFLILSMITFNQANAQTDDFYFNILQPAVLLNSFDSGQFASVQPNVWGWSGILAEEILGELVLPPADSTGAHLFCESDGMDYTGKIVLIDRGECLFSEKAWNAQVQGAVAVVIANDQQGQGAITPGPGGLGADVTIPLIMLSYEDAEPISNALEQSITVLASFTFTPQAGTFVTGSVLLDDGDCMINEPELGLPGFKVIVEDDQFSKTTMTSSSGQYSTSIGPGTYTISTIPTSDLWMACPPQTFEIVADEILDLDLQANAVIECSYLTVDISNSILRRCFDTNSFYINYCNQGTAIAEDAYLILNLPEYITIVNSSADYTELGVGQLDFQLGDLAIGECGTINFTALLSCEAELGQILCVSVEIFPHPTCDETSNWANVDVRASASCENEEAVLSLFNQGEEDMPESSTYRVIRDETIIETGTYLLVAGDAIVFSYMADGATYRIESDDLPFTPQNSSPSAAVEWCSPESDPETNSSGFITLFPPADYGSFFDRMCMEVIGSFDPNDKLAHIIGYGPKHYINQNVALEYTIRFQNTGTDTAFTVRLLDTLSQFLDLASLRPLSASHTYEFELTDNILSVNFPNILLPDSTANEPGSNGFISFIINQNIDVPLESEITNRAGIYFDFNDPIITNTLLHTVGKDFLPVVVSNNNLLATDAIEIYPNPANSYLTIHLKEARLLQQDFLLYNGLGQLVKSQQLNALQASIQIGQLPAGTYYYVVGAEDAVQARGKIVVVR